MTEAKTCHECEYVGADKIGEFCVICVRDVTGRVACSTFSSPEPKKEGE